MLVLLQIKQLPLDCLKTDMAAKMTLQGVYYYPDERALRRVMAAARDRLDEWVSPAPLPLTDLSSANPDDCPAAATLTFRGSCRYDVAPDGQSFVMVQQDFGGAEEAELRVVLNWFEELTRRVPGGQ